MIPFSARRLTAGSDQPDDRGHFPSLGRVDDRFFRTHPMSQPRARRALRPRHRASTVHPGLRPDDDRVGEGFAEVGETDVRHLVFETVTYRICLSRPRMDQPRVRDGDVPDCQMFEPGHRPDVGQARVGQRDSLQGQRHQPRQAGNPLHAGVGQIAFPDGQMMEEGESEREVQVFVRPQPVERDTVRWGPFECRGPVDGGPDSLQVGDGTAFGLVRGGASRWTHGTAKSWNVSAIGRTGRAMN